MSNVKIISFGKNFHNLVIAVQNSLIGSEFSTFEEKIKQGDLVFFACDSLIWGYADVVSNVFQNDNRIWNDKKYPYRAHIDNVKIFTTAFNLADYSIDAIFRDKIGKHWAFKVLFTPGKIPKEAESDLKRIQSERSVLQPKEIPSYLEFHSKNIESKRRKKLGLKPIE